MRSIALSWVLYSVRETIGLTNVRNAILEKKIQRLGKYEKNSIQYGKTFSYGDTYEDIFEMIANFENSGKRYLIFTSNGEIVQQTNKRMRYDKFDEFNLVESRYISFIVDREDMTVTIADPSRNNGHVGIYNPYIGLELQPFFKKNGYKIEWLEMTSPCQINYHDVFCQSWTMILVFKWMKYGDKEKIYISRTQNKKYRKLLRYFKKLVKFEIFKTELNISYLENIKYHENYNLLKNYDPCVLLMSMTPVEMNEDDESIED